MTTTPRWLARNISSYLADGSAVPLLATDAELAATSAADRAAAVPAGDVFAPVFAGRAAKRADVLVVGDSITEGQGATSRGTRWINLLQRHLRRRYPTTGLGSRGGEGYVAGYQTQTSYVHGWNYGGNVSGDGTFGFGHRTVVIKSPDGFASRTVTGTSIRWWFTKGASTGSFRVKVDGTTVATVSTTGAATIHDGGVGSHTFTTPGTHLVRFEWASGGDCYLNGVQVFDGDEAKGVQVIDCGSYGSASSNWNPATNSNAYTLADSVAVLQPPLVLIELGTNDWGGNIASATYKTNMAALIAQVRAACTVPPKFLLVAVYERSTAQTESWANYVARCYEIAAADPAVTVLDLSAVLPKVGQTGTGYYNADNVHPSERGHEFIAQAVADLLAA